MNGDHIQIIVDFLQAKNGDVIPSVFNKSASLLEDSVMPKKIRYDFLVAPN